MSPNGTTTSTPNWLASIFGLAVLATIALGLTACEEPKEIGLTPTTPVGVFYTDTLTLRTSTVLLDSVQTDRSRRLLVGNYNDPTFGRITARAFGMLDIIGTNATPNEVKLDSDVTLDSAKVFVDYNFAYGDTNRTQDLFIHRLTEELDTNKRYTINSSAQFAASPLAKITIPAGSPTGTAVLSEKLPTAVGQELLDLVKGNGINRANFRKAFRGLAFIPGSGNTSIAALGATGTTAIVLYYRKPSETSSSVIGFPINPVSYRSSAFSQVTVNRTGTALASLTTTRPLPLSATGGQTFLQGVTGVTTKIEFPTLENLKKLGPIAINRAELTLTPTTTTGNQLPFYLLLGERDRFNQLAYTVQDRVLKYHFVQVPGNSFGQGTQSWVAPEQVTYGQTYRNSYTFDLSGYFQALLTGFRPNNGLVLVPALAPLSGQTGYQAQANLNIQPSAAIFGPGSVKLVIFYTLQKQ